MSFFEYIMDGGGMLLLGLFVAVTVLFNKVKANRDFKIPSKKKNKRS